MDWELEWIKRRKWAEPWPPFSVSWGWVQGSRCLMPSSGAMPSSPLCIFTRPMGQNKTFLPLAPIQIYFLKPGMMVYKSNSRIQKAEAGASQVREMPGPHSETSSQHLKYPKILLQPYTFLFPTTQTPRPIKVSSLFTFTKSQLGCKIFTENTWLKESS